MRWFKKKGPEKIDLFGPHPAFLHFFAINDRGTLAEFLHGTEYGRLNHGTVKASLESNVRKGWLNKIGDTYIITPKGRRAYTAYATQNH